MSLRYFRHDGAGLHALAHNGRLLGARPPPAVTAASDPLVSNTSHRVDGSVLFTCKPMRGVESIAHGLALSHQPGHAGMWGRGTAYKSFSKQPQQSSAQQSSISAY